jgi:CRP/FNR family cyclic AMP-dependent transcriptional regulator
MTARIIHFGIDDFDRLRILREAGYSVDSSSSLAEFHSFFTSSAPVDAVAITESRGALPANLMSFNQVISSVPLILFQGWTSNGNESGFNLVVPVLTPPNKWLKEIETLVDQSRARCGAPHPVGHESVPPREKDPSTAVKLRPEMDKFAKEYTKKGDLPESRGAAFEIAPGNLNELRKGQFLKSMSQEMLVEFCSLASFSSCASGTVLFAEGQAPHEVFVLLEGQVKLFMNSNDGKRLTVHIAGSGETLGLPAMFTTGAHRTSAETLYPCKLASIPCPDFLKFFQFHPQASQSVARELGELCNRTYIRLRTIGVTPSNRAKLARLLLEWSSQGKRTRVGTEIHVALKHGEIAECIGTCRESVTRILRDLQRRNVIELHGSLLRITDLDALEQCAGLS